MPTAPFDSPYEMTLSQFITSFLDYPSLRLATKCLPQLVALVASKCHSFGRKRLRKLCTMDNGFYDDLFDVSLCPLIRSRKRQFAPSVSLVLDYPFFFVASAGDYSVKEGIVPWNPQSPDNYHHK